MKVPLFWHLAFLCLCCECDSNENDRVKPKKILFAHYLIGKATWGIREAGPSFFSRCNQNNCLAEYDEEEYLKGKPGIIL